MSGSIWNKDSMEIEILRQHLETQYAGVFDSKMIQQHIDEYVDTTNAERFVQDLVSEGYQGKRLLDIGSGYGSIVLEARNHGIDAIGIELAEFEIEFAKDRLCHQRPNDNAEIVYKQGDAAALAFESESFDIVTILNVLEHVPDYRQVLKEAVRVLCPGGLLYIICPNYLAFRKEAHYQVPWLPLLPKRLAILYLKLLGRNPEFFKDSIFYCTNWGLLKYLSRLPLTIYNPDLRKAENLSSISNQKIRKVFSFLNKYKLLWIIKWGLKINFYNPFKSSIFLYARKKDNL